MNCPVCNRNNAVTLSICPSCGAMINDSVREELVTKISPVLKSANSEIREKPAPTAVSNQENQPPAAKKPHCQVMPAVIQSSPKVKAAVEKRVEKTATTEISVKPTAPTLVEFHNKNAALPEWRLQLQNVVRQRQARPKTENQDAAAALCAPPTIVATDGANALKVEVQPEAEVIFHSNPKVNSALQRIQNSRRQFLVEEKQEIEAAAVAPAVAAAPNKNYPFYIAGRTPEISPSSAPVPEPKPATINSPVKPKIAAPLKSEKKEFDTNKLPPLSAKVSSSFEKNSEIANEEAEDSKKPDIKLVAAEEVFEAEDVETEEIEDLAPFAMRFNAGLFDFIIGSFLSLILLAPFMLMGGNWFSFPGMLAFLATCAVVMFIYMTTTIGLYGRTFGMRLFALEIIDIEGENYPTVHQAAVSSSVYLLSLAFGGLGFLTLPFNEEKRAVHDLVSGTIVVKEI